MIRSTPRIQALSATTPFVGPEALARQQGIAEAQLLRLGANESSFGASPLATEAMQREIARAAYYGDPEIFELRTALARRLSCLLEEVLVASGIDDLIGLILRAFAAEGMVVATEGTYPTFFYHANGHGATCVTVPYDHTKPNLDALAERVRATNAALVYIANPDNPGGGFLERDALAAFIESMPEDTVVLLDEAYAEYVSPESLLPPSIRPNLIRMRTFSKVYGLAGLRIGYAWTDANLVAEIGKIRQHFGVSRLSIAAAAAALQDQAFVAGVVAENARGREEYHAFARECGLESYASSTNFVLFELGSVARATALVAALLRRGVFIRKPVGGALASCVRISVGTTAERARLREALRGALADIPATAAP